MRVPKGPRASSFSAATTLFAVGVSLALLVACSKPAQSSTMKVALPVPVPTATCPAPHAMARLVTFAVDAASHTANAIHNKNITVPACTDAKIGLALNGTGYQITEVTACKPVGAFSVQISSGKAIIIDHNTDPKAKGAWFYRITVKGNGGEYHTKDLCGQDPPPSIHNQ